MKQAKIIGSLLFFMAFTSMCFAQKKHVDDVYGIDTSDAPAPTITNQNNFPVPNFVDGYIITKNNTTMYGQVRFNGTVAIFKDTVTQKIKRFGPTEIRGFVAAADTFRTFTDTVVLRPNPFYRPYYGMQPFYGTQYVLNVSFLRLMVYGPKVSLFKALRETPTYAYGRYGSGTAVQDAFYLERKNQWGYTIIPSNRRDFKRLMAAYLADDPLLLQDINDDRLTYDNIDEIVKRYNNAN